MKKFLALLGLFILIAVILVNSVVASQSNFTASGFSQFCAANPTTCTKTNFQDVRIGTVSCPSTNQIITTVYVHAGDGQLVWELPDSKFTYQYSNNQNTVTVTALDGTHNISWIGVVCETGATPTNTPTPTTTPTATPTQTPTKTPTPTPTLTIQPTATPTPNIIIDCPGQGECEVIIGSTPTPTATVTPTPTNSESPTATPAPGSSDNSNSSTGGTSSSSTNGQVLGSSIGGASTLAATGTAAQTASHTSLITGILLMGIGILNHVKKTKIFWA